jgi:hypothetical protein
MNASSDIMDAETGNENQENKNIDRITIESITNDRVTKCPRNVRLQEMGRRRQGMTLSRLDIRVNMQPIAGDQGTTPQLKRHLQEIVDKLRTIDPSILIIPWFDTAESIPMPKNTVPDDQRNINKYFARIKPVKQGMTYGEVQIQHEKKWEDIIYNMTAWLTEKKHVLYYQYLQCQTTTNLGWLLWSFRKIDTKQLQYEIENIYNIRVNLRYQNIATGKGQSSSQNVVRALHVTADQSKAEKVSMLFQKIYSFTANRFPLGISMRFIPHILRVHSDKVPRIIRWRKRQQTFLDAIENNDKQMVATSWEITLLDYDKEGFGTLRKKIMSLNSKEKKGEPLFLSVDTSFFRSNEIIFSFLPRNEQEARSFVANLVPFYYHQYEESLLQDIFEKEALTRAKETKWNSDTLEVISPSDFYLDESGDVVDDYDMLESMGVVDNLQTVQTNSTIGDDNALHKVQRLFAGEETDSIGSLFSHNTTVTGYKGPNLPTNYEQDTETKINIPGTQSNQTQQNNVNNASSSSKSVGTTITIEELDQNVNKLSQAVDDIKVMLQHILSSTCTVNNNNTTLEENMEVMEEDRINKRKAGVPELVDTCNEL